MPATLVPSTTAANATGSPPATGFTSDRNPDIRAFLPRTHHARSI
jgi:hypothetical protein